jgi:hypothetical protein
VRESPVPSDQRGNSWKLTARVGKGACGALSSAPRSAARAKHGSAPTQVSELTTPRSSGGSASAGPWPSAGCGAALASPA